MKKLIIIAGSVLLVGGFATFALGATAAEQPGGAQASTLPNIVQTAAQSGDVQEITAPVEIYGYPDITVEAGKPVRINFKVDAADLNACNNEIIIPEWNIDKKLSAGDNFVEFTPTKAGTYRYTCWMGMIGANITVAEPGTGEAGATAPAQSAGGYGGGCGMMGGFGRGAGNSNSGFSCH